MMANAVEEGLRARVASERRGDGKTMDDKRGDGTANGPIQAPGSRATEPSLFPVAVAGAASAAASSWMSVSAANLNAIQKSRAIFARGLRAIGVSSFGITLMSVEQAIAAAQAVSACRTGADWVALQGNLARLATRRMVDSFILLSHMHVQVFQDAWVPLKRRAEAAADAVWTASEP